MRGILLRPILPPPGAGGHQAAAKAEGDTMNKWLVILAVLRQGAMLTNAATWKERQVLVNAIAGLLTAGYMLARSQGWIAIEVDNAALLDLGSAIGAVLYTAFNIFFTAATTKKIGLAPADPVPAPPSQLREPSRPADTGSVQADPGRGAGDASKRDVNPFLDDQ